MTLYLPSTVRKLERAIMQTLPIAVPPRRQNLSEYSDANRILSPEDSAEPGKWNSDRFRLQIDIMNEMSNPYTERVVIVAASQLGKTQMVMNALQYYIDYDPSPVLFVHYSEKMAEDWSKDRFAPMIRDNPTLRERIGDPKSKTTGNTILHKSFPGGHITAVGANSPANLASRPIRILFLDEVDRYPSSAGSEGNPVKLAIARTKTFDNRKIIMISSPGNTESSRIWAEYENTDQRKYLVPCPHCGHEQELVWEQIKFPDRNPANTYYECIECKEPITEQDKYPMVQSGRWVATHPERKNRPGFHLSELYSPWSTWEDMVRDFLEAREKQKGGDHQDMKVFKNTRLALTWDEAVSSDIKTETLMQRRESYTLTEGVLYITAGVDVQDDRLEVLVIGWGENEESWVLGFKQIWGNPAIATVWNQLFQYLTTPIEGRKINSTGVDTGGHHTQQAYAFVKANRHYRVKAFKGANKIGQPIAPRRPSLNNKGKVPLYFIGVHAAKDLIFARLRIDTPGPGYMHFNNEFCDEEYFSQLTSEVKEKYIVAGQVVYRWVKPEHKRNEILDLTVYALAALKIDNPNLKHLQHIADEAKAKGETVKPGAMEQPKKMKLKRRSNWSI